MKFVCWKKFVASLTGLCLLFQHLAWASPDPFLLKGQKWGRTAQDFEYIRERVLLVRTPLGKRLIQVNMGSHLDIVDLKTSLIQSIPIPTRHVTLSKNYLFIVPKFSAQKKRHGFYALRLIDYYHYGFRGPVPFFFIPTNKKLGPVRDISVQHNDVIKEAFLYIRTQRADHPVVTMPFSDAEDLIKAQVIAYALNHLQSKKTLKGVGRVVKKTKTSLLSLYMDLNRDLKAVGGKRAKKLASKSLSAIDWKGASVTELTKALSETDKNPQLKAIKMRYAKRLSKIIAKFYSDYSKAIEKSQLSFSQEYSTLHQKIKTGEAEIDSSDADNIETEKALAAYTGLALAALFVVAVLPKLLKRPFSDMAADYATLHFKTLNRSWIRVALDFVVPKRFHDAARYQGLVHRLSVVEKQYEGLRATSNQFKRGFWKATGETTAVIMSEIALRPFFRHPGQLGAAEAIILSEPFNDMHTLWIQKNVLMRLVGAQLIGSLTTTIQLAIIEKELGEIVKHFVLNSKLEGQLARKLNDMQRRNLATLIEQDLKALKKEMAYQLSKHRMDHPGKVPSIKDLKLSGMSKKMGQSWVQKLEIMTGSLNAAKQTAIGHTFEAKILSFAQTSLDTHIAANKNPGFMKKCMLAMGAGLHRSLGLVLGERSAIATTTFMKKALRVWIYDLKPTLAHHAILQPLTRGGFNASIFAFNRIVMLLIFTPFFIFTYESTKKRINFKNPRQDFFFGLAYGIVTCLTYNFLFVNIYEKNIRESKLDFEFNIFRDKVKKKK